MKRTQLKAAAAFALVILLALLAASSAFAGEEGDKANSWRFKDGQPIAQASSNVSDSGTLYATSVMASSNTRCWVKSYGTTKMYDKESGHGLTAVSGALEVCIDVSEHNGKINWSKVAADGITSAIIRCGYGSDFSDQDDDYWLTNIKGARKAGLKVGVYLYSYAKNLTGNDSSAASEGQHALRCLEEAGVSAEELDLPVYYDIEEDYQEKYSSKTLVNMCLNFAAPLEAAGYQVGVYAGSDLFKEKLDGADFEAQNWSKWVPHYNNHCEYCTTGSGKQDVIANYGKYLDIWQFGSCGKVNGISGNVDMNFIFNDLTGSKLRYVLNGGINSSSNPDDYTIGDTTIKLANPKRTGYTFKGWYTTGTFSSSSKVTSIDCSKEKQVLYAKWSLKTYKITYKLYKGTMPSSYTKSYTVESSSFKLPVPGKKGYGFAGWYTSSKRTGSAVSKITAGSTGNKTYYAKWVKGGANAKVTASTLNIRKKASTSSKVAGTLSKGTVVCLTKLNAKKTWGYISGKGWICLKYAPLTSYYAKVTSTQLSARKGAGSSYAVKKTLKKSTKIWIYETKGSWGHALGKGWVKLKYTKKL